MNIDCLSLGCFLGLSLGLSVVASGATNALVNAAAAKTGGARTLEQLKQDFLNWKFGMFLHFNMETFQNLEGWGNGYEDPASFKPDRLDCRQWARVAKSAGMRYAVLTVKHTSGWCVWNSPYTTHDAEAFVNFRNGKGDVVREFVEAFRAEGLKVGFYYCGPGEYAGRCGAPPVPKGKPDLRGMPPEAAGDGEFMKKQFTELLTNYGPIDLMWWDGFYREDLKQVVRSLQPGCLIVVNNNHNAEQTDIIGFEMPIGASVPADNTTPGEACDVITSDPALRAWFWTEKEGAAGLKGLKSADAIVELLNTCNSRKANLLLNAGPDIHGLIPEYSVQRLAEVGRKLALTGK